MDAARRSGRVRVWCLGVGLDPLTLWGEILTVAVFDDEVFDELFSGLVVANDEGMVVTLGTPGRPAHGVPFVEERSRSSSGRSRWRRPRSRGWRWPGATGRGC
jgi:hypothetical protein